MLEADKQYFTDMIAAVRAKLNCLPTGSLIKKYFPESRLDAISRKIAATEAKTLQWDYWQPLFLFLRNQSESALDALLNAPRQISGIVLFDGCRLKLARLNYNTRRDYRMSHEEMAFFERLLSEPAAYCQ